MVSLLRTDSFVVGRFIARLGITDLNSEFSFKGAGEYAAKPHLPGLGAMCYFRMSILRVAVKVPAVTESRVDSVDNV